AREQVGRREQQRAAILVHRAQVHGGGDGRVVHRGDRDGDGAGGLVHPVADGVGEGGAAVVVGRGVEADGPVAVQRGRAAGAAGDAHDAEFGAFRIVVVGEQVLLL